LFLHPVEAEPRISGKNRIFQRIRAVPNLFRSLAGLRRFALLRRREFTKFPTPSTPRDELPGWERKVDINGIGLV
jgi:hypothetical protein